MLTTDDLMAAKSFMRQMGRDAEGQPIDRDAMLVFADWLEEKGWQYAANNWRRWHKKLEDRK